MAPRSGADTVSKRRGTPSPERGARLEESLEDQVEELECGITDDDEQADDAESYDPTSDYGLDPSFDDGDPSESGREGGGWDGIDDANIDEGAALVPHAPDATIVPEGAGFRVLISQIRRGLPLPTDKDDEDAFLRICQAVASRQKEFLLTGDGQTMNPMTQADLVAIAHVDAARVSRLVTNRSVELPSGEVLPLFQLLQDPADARASCIEKILQELDDVVRDRGGAVVTVRSLASKEEIVKQVRQKFGEAGSSEASVRAIMKARDLPVDPRKRRERYEEGSDWWSS